METLRHLYFLVVATLLLAVYGSGAAGQVPAELPDPDGKPGNATQPVKVYILAGQSNMVGMGDISGAKNMYTGVFLTSDPAAPIGPLPIYRVGNYNIAPLAIFQPDGTLTNEPIAKGQLEVPNQGVYQVHCGHGENSYVTMTVDGKTVYQRKSGSEPILQQVTLKPGKRHEFEISGMSGEAPRFWMQKMDLLGYGDLETVTKREGMFPWLVDDAGNWTVRQDVYMQEARLAEGGKGSLLTATSNGHSIGPELGFGHVMGTFHDEQVLVIKTAQGNRSLGFDFRPPSSGRTDPESKWEGLEYRLMVEGVRNTLENIDKILPGYQGQGYEIAGFAWWQGHKDAGATQAEYEKHLVNLINDLRKEFKVPKMPAVVATVGFEGHNMGETYQQILEAQMAVGDPEQHPEFAGTVASVDTRDFWREVDESPKAQGYHYHRNAETYLRVGDALGRAMVRLQGGEAEPLPQPARKRRGTPPEAAELTEDQQAAAQQALAPIIMDGIAPSYINNPRNQKSLKQEAGGERPPRENQFLQGTMYGLINCYRAAGIGEYDWHVFGEDLRDVEWEYFSFDPPEALDPEKGPRFRDVTFPAGMENWYSPKFDAAKAGWKKGLTPFGSLGGKLEPLGQCDRNICGCGEKPRTLWENEVLLIRGTFDIPPLKQGHRYRIVVGGSAHVSAGEGFAIYVDGKPFASSKSGVGKRQGAQPRGGHVYADFRDEFSDGKVSIAVMSFLRYNHPRIKPYPPRGHLTVWLEEQQVPPLLSRN